MSENKWVHLAKYGYLVMAGMMIALGITLFVSPAFSAALLCSLGGWGLILFGLVKLVGYCSKDLYRLAFQHDLAAGALIIVLGLAVVLCPDRMVQMIFVLLGLCILADALLKIQISIDAKVFGIRQWWWILTVAVVTGIAGLILLFRPGRSAQGVMSILGPALVTEGILNLITVLSSVKVAARR